VPQIKTHCKICNCRCGIVATVNDGRVEKISGDPECKKNDGALCIKGKVMLELLYDPDRLLYPMVRQGENWNRLSWDSALTQIARKLLQLKATHGPQSVAIYRGMSVYSWLVAVFLNRFGMAFGTPNFASNAALCVSSKVIATHTSFGRGVSVGGDFRNSRCILLLGTNPAVTGMHRSLRIMKDILAAKKAGAKLIVVDPRKTETAVKADIYTTIRPGTDTAFIMGLVNYIIENELFDSDFVSRYTHGFEQLKAAARKYTPKMVEQTTWVHEETLQKIARMFATNRPACADRREGVIHHEHGTETCLAINILNAITGNVDVDGGVQVQTNLFDKSSDLFRELTGAEQFMPAAAPVTGRNPFTGDVPTALLEAILKDKPYPIRGMIVVGSNPLISWPQTDMVRRALQKLELLVIVDLYRNDTAVFAHYALPAATFLEKLDLQAPNVAIPRVVQLQKPVIPPLGESRSESWIIKALADKLGYGSLFCETDEQVMDRILSQMGLRTEELKNHPSGMVIEPRPVGYYHSHPYPTPSGMIELYSDSFEKKGGPGLPSFREPSESPISSPQIAERFPLVLVTGNRLRSSYLSFLHNLPTLHAKNPENWVELHPEAAAARGIENGERVVVESPRGSIKLPAKVSPDIDPRVVAIPYGWGHHFNGSWQLANRDPGANPNVLLDYRKIDKLSGMPNFKSTLCEVRKVEGGG